MVSLAVLSGIDNVVLLFLPNCPRGIQGKLGDFELIFCGFSVIFTIFALIKHIKSKIWFGLAVLSGIDNVVLLFLPNCPRGIQGKLGDY